MRLLSKRIGVIAGLLAAGVLSIFLLNWCLESWSHPTFSGGELVALLVICGMVWGWGYVLVKLVPQ